MKDITKTFVVKGLRASIVKSDLELEDFLAKCIYRFNSEFRALSFDDFNLKNDDYSYIRKSFLLKGFSLDQIDVLCKLKQTLTEAEEIICEHLCINVEFVPNDIEGILIEFSLDQFDKEYPASALREINDKLSPEEKERQDKFLIEAFTTFLKKD